jgi:tripartite-type tricarboxylate transporter receptor subunit TctC
MGHVHRRTTLGLGAAVALARPALGQGGGPFPSRPIRAINPFAAGGSTDVQMRSLCALASPKLGQPVVVENRPGGGGFLGMLALVNEAKPDGHLLSQVGTGTPARLMMAPHAPLDPMTDFTWVCGMIGYLFGVVVRADAPWATWRDLLAHARATPGRVNYGTPGVGTPPHFAMELIAQREGVQWTHVPFRGGSEVHPAVLGGQIQVGVDSSTWAPLVEEGKMRLLVVFAAERARRYPGVPTLREEGVDLVTDGRYGLAAPPGLDRGIARVLHAALRDALLDPAHLAVLDRYGMAALPKTPEECAEDARQQRQADRALLERLGLRLS